MYGLPQPIRNISSSSALHPKVNSPLVSQAEGKVGCLYVVTQSLDTLSIMMRNSFPLPLSDTLPHLIPGAWVFTSEYFLTTLEQEDTKSCLAFCRLNKSQILAQNLKRFFLAITTSRSQGTPPQPKFILSQLLFWPSEKDPLGSLGEGRMAAPDVADR